MGRPPQPAQLAPEPIVSGPHIKPSARADAPIGMQAMLAPPAVLLTRGVTVACLAGAVCGVGLFGALAFTAGFAAMGGPLGAAVVHGAAVQGAVGMYGAMYPAATIAYFTSARAQPSDDDDVVVPAGMGLTETGTHHHHAAEGQEYESQAQVEAREREAEPREAFREVE